jgi:hypothetical protein
VLPATTTVIGLTIRTYTHPGANSDEVHNIVADYSTPFLPSDNWAPCRDGDSNSIDGVALVAQADFLLAALTEEIERSRRLRDGYSWLKKRRRATRIAIV